MIPDDPILQTFALIWCFSDAQKYAHLSTAEFQRFRPLSEVESLACWKQYVYPDVSPRHRHLMELRVQRLITWPQRPSFLSELRDEEQQIVPTLQKVIPAAGSSLALFFWHAELAVQTDWRLFLDHWDDFCYPSDDSNIVVLPEVGKAVVYIKDWWYVFNRLNTGTVFAPA